MTVVLDTHVAVWWSCLPKRLSRAAARALDEAEVIGIPAIAFWEIALLVRRRKLELEMPVREWAEQVLSIPRLRALPLTWKMGVLADSLEMHPDPADRFIVATALELDATLITKDVLIRRTRLAKTIW